MRTNEGLETFLNLNTNDKEQFLINCLADELKVNPQTEEGKKRIRAELEERVIKNKIFTYAMTSDRKMFKTFLGKEVEINGQLITYMGTKVLIDAIQMT